ncbi:unnamed protein product [Rotaria socialis]|uniref:Uncharacterized protein n=1 Tax=Rotaria socialis TaxID=392032 RepID=A0A818VJR7_9BILA|nr:unnamed protein product [Rotaria socialis]CAF3393658.1 unnamed protein product [Rotaria socialis]CAF3708363.1 unnamed protein product [Rotaria socialis]CAF3723324.1 unnamed protein product [Rotaria socialis]CAF4265183.1 unnamed protein product [Rotaria socialis]
MLLFYISLVCLVQSSFSVELSIYKSFTEVHQVCYGIGEHALQFTNADYGNIIDESISWIGTPLLRQEIYSTIQSLQNAKVIVRRSTVCGCETIEAKIVDPDSMLLQNVNTGAYFYADKQSIEYSSVRPNEGRTTLALRFETENTQYNGTLSYLMKGITWKPTYDLLLRGENDCKLVAFANIKNDQQSEYTVEMTHLLGGDVPLATGYSNPSHALEFDKKPTNLRPIQLDGEQKGVYSYSLNDKYTLRPSSSIRLPFIDIIAKYKFYYKASASISAGTYQGVFERIYDLTPDHFMPAGTVTIHDNQVLVGQVALPDVPENYTQTFAVGQDNDVRYTIKGNLTAKSDDKAPKSFETYNIDVNVMNFKGKKIDTQLVFQAGIQIILLESTCKSVNVQGNQLNMLVQLNQNERRSCKLNATVQFN